MNIKTTVWVGKNGITESLLNEIASQLEYRKVIKIKFLKNSDRENFREISNQIAEYLGAEIVDMRGFTVTLRKLGNK